MPETITANTRVPFGTKRFPGQAPMKGRKLCELSDSALRWIAGMRDTDLHAWAVAAQGVLDFRAKIGQAFAAEDDAEAQANALLKNAGFGHLAKPLKPEGRRRGGRERTVRRF